MLSKNYQYFSCYFLPAKYDLHPEMCRNQKSTLILFYFEFNIQFDWIFCILVLLCTSTKCLVVQTLLKFYKFFDKWSLIDIFAVNRPVQDCHCLLDIAPHAIERLHSVHIYPIVIFIRYKNAKQIKWVAMFSLLSFFFFPSKHLVLFYFLLLGPLLGRFCCLCLLVSSLYSVKSRILALELSIMWTFKSNWR